MTPFLFFAIFYAHIMANSAVQKRGKSMNKKEGFIASIILAIYGIFMFLVGIFTGKNKAEADILGKILKRNDELKDELKKVEPFDREKVSPEEVKEMYNNLSSDEEKLEFIKKIDMSTILDERRNELLKFGEKI